MRIAIIEDEQVHIDFLLGLLDTWSGENESFLVIDTFPSAESFLFVWEERKEYDVLFVDIQMKEMNGMEMAKRIRRDDNHVAIIFTTGITDYLEEGYEVEALHYLIKPIDKEKVKKCMDKVLQRLKKEQYVILNVSNGNERKRFLVDQISYIEARGHRTVAEIMPDKKADREEAKTIELSDSFSDMIKQLNGNQFIQCHRSYICNLKCVHHIDKTSICLDSGTSIPVSRRMYGEVNQAFIKYYRNLGD